MKREIKFKVWDNKENQWIWNIGMKTNNVLTNGKEQGLFNILQFTGLKDKNGVEIYEGDICKNDYSIGFVRFDYGWAIEYKEKYSHDMPQYYCDRLEKIGNIYDSPELLGS